jgi:membrane-associated phospholipid phosphatase
MQKNVCAVCWSSGGSCVAGRVGAGYLQMTAALGKGTIRYKYYLLEYSGFVMILFIIITLIVVACNYYIDVPVALFIQGFYDSNSIWFSLTSDLPDALLLVVGVTTVGAYACYRRRVASKVFDAMTRLSLLIAVDAPVSYGAKGIAKSIFGRVTTRAWLKAQETYGFHWFQGGDYCGFPSGHMVVFATLLAALWRVFPRWKYLYLSAGTVLAAALIATNYHFVGDVVAGAYLGMVVESVIYRIIRQKIGGQKAGKCGS